MLRVKLVHMDDPYPLPECSTGTIIDKDDIGDLLVHWDCGSSLKLIPSIDTYIIYSSSVSVK